MLIDSHCHPHFIARDSAGNFFADLTQTYIDNTSIVLENAAYIFERAKQSGIGHVLCAATELTQFNILNALKEQFNDYISISIGLHPNDLPDFELTFDELYNLASNPNFIAIGETGLDYYRIADPKWQMQRFVTHIAVARACKKPLIIHSRAARHDTIAALKAHKAYEARGVFHCFTEDWSTAKAALDLDFFISFSGIITFKNAADLCDVAKRVPLDRVLLETDAPFLAPQQYRGKINEPQYMRDIATFFADLRGLSFLEICNITHNNFRSLFGVC